MILAEFLLARITEDESVAREVAGALARDPDADDAREWYANEAGSNGDPIVAVGPTRALAECEAKRRIIALHHSVQNGRSDPSCSDLYGDWDTDSNDCDTLRALVQPYADHADFDPAWRS